jgi:hypothetical protein
MDPKIALHWGRCIRGKTRLVFSLGAFTTVSQAEVFAIIAAIHESIMGATMVGKSRYLVIARLP